MITKDTIQPSSGHAADLTSQQALHEALDESLRYDTYYPSGGLQLFSHLPMVLGALTRLGAPPSALRRQLDHWRELSVPARSLPAAVPALDSVLPDLLLSAHVDAFHAAIRMAYALQSGHAGEQRAALAAWLAKAPLRSHDAQARPAGPSSEFSEASEASRATAAAAAHPGERIAPVTPRAHNGLREVLAAVRADPRLRMAAAGGTLIVTRLQQAQALPAFSEYQRVPQLALEDLAEASLAVYLATHDFTALHLVTGTHALRELIEAARARDLALDLPRILAAFWSAWLAAFIAIRRPAPAWDRVHAGSASEADWEAALPALADTVNDHRIKLADAAREEWRHRGWPGYVLCLEARRPARRRRRSPRPARCGGRPPGRRAAPRASPGCPPANSA